YTDYLSNYKKDKWITKGGDPYHVSNREESLEERAFYIITKYYLNAINSEKEWNIATMKSYLKLIRVVLVSYEIRDRNIESFVVFFLVLILYRKNILFMSFKTIYRIFNLIAVKILLGGKNKKQKTSSEKSKKEIFHNEAN